jgi:hypothetical protein
MVANVGNIDRLLRLVLGAVLIIAPYVAPLALLQSPAIQIIVVAVGLVLVITALFRFCPLYRLLGMATCRTQAQSR